MKLTIYTLKDCPACHKTMQYLKNHHFDFQEIQINNNLALMKELKAKSGFVTVPIIEMAGKYLTNFEERELEDFLAKNPSSY